ncbi:MAG: hypothetical protein ABI850_01630 [Flavobacterium sp.]
MNLHDFMEKSNELKEICEGIGQPVVNKALTDFVITPEDAYIF